MSSSSEGKIRKAVGLGAKGGVNYNSVSWSKDLAQQLPASRSYLDVVIDSGGGNIANTSARLLKDGGIVSCYGSASRVDPPVGMVFVLKNLEFRGQRETRSSLCAVRLLTFRHIRLDHGQSRRVHGSD